VLADFAVNLYEQSSRNTVTLVRWDDPLDGVRQASIDIAVVRGEIPSSAPVRGVHPFERRVALGSEHSSSRPANRCAGRALRSAPLS
jgi:hypothetical protein